ncbi:hypothetical protein ACOMHN_021101 [Nucella lapillus]
MFTIFRVPTCTLLLRLTDGADETGRWCAHPREGGRIPPGHVRDGPRFHFAFGFRTTQRLARMLDSLVRVSRRVGWRADRFATDPVPAGPTHRTVQGSGRQTRLPSLCQSNIPGGRGGPSRRRLLGPRGRIGTGEAIPARAEARTYHPRRLLTAREPVVALCPRKVHTADARPETGRVLRSPTRRPVAAAFRAEFRGPTLRIHPFTSRRFHVLLNSLFKVLFNFPSRYLSAIGLVPVFSLRWSLPPA